MEYEKEGYTCYIQTLVKSVAMVNWNLLHLVHDEFLHVFFFFTLCLPRISNNVTINLKVPQKDISTSAKKSLNSMKTATNLAKNTAQIMPE